MSLKDSAARAAEATSSGVIGAAPGREPGVTGGTRNIPAVVLAGGRAGKYDRRRMAIFDRTLDSDINPEDPDLPRLPDGAKVLFAVMALYLNFQEPDEKHVPNPDFRVQKAAGRRAQTVLKVENPMYRTTHVAQERLARETGANVRSVCKWQRMLRERGLIGRQRRDEELIYDDEKRRNVGRKFYFIHRLAEGVGGNFAVVPRELILDAELSDAAKVQAMARIMFQGKNNPYGWASDAEIAKACGHSPDTAQRAKQKLIARGWLDAKLPPPAPDSPDAWRWSPAKCRRRGDPKLFQGPWRMRKAAEAQEAAGSGAEMAAKHVLSPAEMAAKHVLSPLRNGRKKPPYLYQGDNPVCTSFLPEEPAAFDTSALPPTGENDSVEGDAFALRKAATPPIGTSAADGASDPRQRRKATLEGKPRQSPHAKSAR